MSCFSRLHACQVVRLSARVHHRNDGFIHAGHRSDFHAAPRANRCSGRESAGCPRQAGDGVDARGARAAGANAESNESEGAQETGQSLEAHDPGTAPAVPCNSEAAVGENGTTVTIRKAPEVGSTYVCIMVRAGITSSTALKIAVGSAGISVEQVLELR